MGYQEIIPPERLKEFKQLGPSEVQAKLDAGYYSGNHKRDAILFIKLCESKLNSENIDPESRWHETWWGIFLIGLAVVIVGGGALFWLGWI